MEITEKKPSKIGLGFIISWGLGGILVIGGIVELFTTPGLGIFSLLAGLVIFPPAIKFIKSKTNFELSKVLKILLFFIFAGIGGALAGNSSNTGSSSNIDTPVSTERSSNNAQPTATTQPQKPKEWVTVTESSGSSDKRTDTFALEGGKTKLTYTFDGGQSIIGSIYVVAEGHSIEKEGGFPEVTVTKAGTDSTFLTKDAGNYYLDIKSANTSWTIKIEEER